MSIHLSIHILLFVTLSLFILHSTLLYLLKSGLNPLTLPNKGPEQDTAVRADREKDEEADGKELKEPTEKKDK